jgi:hypothetical protein
MWIGDGPFDSYGYLEAPGAYIKGPVDGYVFEPCHRIFNRGDPNSSDQFQFVPVDENGNELGPPNLETDGQTVYGIWERADQASSVSISNQFMP